jgi:hypothetical protein
MCLLTDQAEEHKLEHKLLPILGAVVGPPPPPGTNMVLPLGYGTDFNDDFLPANRDNNGLKIISTFPLNSHKHAYRQK